ncbi:hypothetical protein EMIT079MI2_630004 [Bacillus sp. IT-79MI2]
MLPSTFIIKLFFKATPPYMPINLRKQIHPKTKKVNLIIMNKCGVKNVVMGIFRNLRENKKDIVIFLNL